MRQALIISVSLGGNAALLCLLPRCSQRIQLVGVTSTSLFKMLAATMFSEDTTGRRDFYVTFQEVTKISQFLLFLNQQECKEQKKDSRNQDNFNIKAS
ncbi:hypothetical protein QE152_g12637 [Popillia japonica]|uniref:Secreted protein n=1 Tax=Popillia japonica TaxID=7064 RepID=A0AAW1LR32_POPJA